MKKLVLISSSVFLLNGCMLFDSYFMAKYDTTEYSLVNKVKTKTELAEEQCADKTKVQSSLVEIYATALEFKNFTYNIARNTDATNMAGKLLVLTKDTKDYFDKNEKISEKFCQLKLQQIVKSADSIQNVIGSKPR